VLLAEDNPTNQLLARRMLTNAGCVVDVAKNGRIALDLAVSKSYDLILMDCQMPELDGYEATRRIRALAPTRVPIVALTANALTEERRRGLDAGMDDYLTKPIRADELRTLIDRFRPSASAMTPSK
jgi:CheY-like chemotaxis protein